MNSREKMLAAGVGIVATLFVGRSFVLGIQEGFETKKSEIASLEKKKTEQDLQMTAGKVASQKLSKIVSKSLPRSEELALADYAKWLIDLADQADLTAPNQATIGEISEKDSPYRLYKFKLYGTGSIENATQLLFGFYAKDYLHRITRFELTPIPNSTIPDQLNISLDCDVLALGIANEKQEPPKGISNRLAKSLDEYKKPILDRNLFSPENLPPKLDSRKSVEAKVGLPLEHTVEAKDPDPNQKVFLELLSDNGDIPKGLVIDKDSGKMSFRSNEVGQYKVLVQATDNGIPKKTSVQSLTINVAALPPVPPPAVQFDVASQAKITALLAGSGGPEAWISSKTENKTYKLKKGDQLKLGGVVGMIKEVGANYVELETEGRKWLFGMDESLSDAYSRATID